MHEGVTEDGVLSTCGICGCQVYMLDPDEMDWICDPCSLDGWSGFKSAWKLTPGDVIHRRGQRLVVLYNEGFGKRVMLSLRGESGVEFDAIFRAVDKIYVHCDREEV
jgi:hypothetical protein